MPPIQFQNRRRGAQGKRDNSPFADLRKTNPILKNHDKRNYKIKQASAVLKIVLSRWF